MKSRLKSATLACALLLVSLAIPALAADEPIPRWIWHPNGGAEPTNGEVRFFRKNFLVSGKVTDATLWVSADDEAEVFINGKSAIRERGFTEAKQASVTTLLRNGENLIAVRGLNDTGPAHFAIKLEIKLKGKASQFVVTDGSWLTTASASTASWQDISLPDSSDWMKSKTFGKSDIFPTQAKNPKKESAATPVEELTILPGFKVELLYKSLETQGSWICMTTDSKGRLIVSPQQDDLPLLRFTLGSHGKVLKVEPIAAPLHQAMGLCYSHDSLYVNGHGPSGTGLYRLVDENNNDQFETNEVHFLKRIGGEGEHGYHGVVEGPDGMIYVMNGNHTRLVDGLEPTSPHKNFQEDQMLPRQWDANGHAVGILSPGGHILRTDAEGKKWELVLAGFRNSYDFDFNADGEIFTYDSDMEWDWGLPWYRPIRIVHAVPAGDYGWRSGSGKWPEYYADSLPPVLNTGIGSPTGVKFGTKSNFPEKYRKAFYAMDWAYGRIYAIHLAPKGASYSGTSEILVKGKSFNVTDLDFGKDGAMYFVTGGRGTASGLYRVTYVGKKEQEITTPAEQATLDAGKASRDLRHQLEAFYGHKDDKAVDFAWPYLGNEDRFIRYAARTVMEAQDVSQWKARALAETQPETALNALLALARCGGHDAQKDLVAALEKFPLQHLSENQRLEKTRILEVSFARDGRPDYDTAKATKDELENAFPAASTNVNKELSQLLIFLGSKDAIGKSLAVMQLAPTWEEQIYYIFQLRNAQTGWTIDQRRQYFEWFTSAPKEMQAMNAGTLPPSQIVRRHPPQFINYFKEAGREYSDGASYQGYLRNIRNDAEKTLTSGERTALAALLPPKEKTPEWKPMKTHAFVKEWTVADLETRLDAAKHGRNFVRGRDTFNDSQCIQCHRFRSEGGSVGPELTGVGGKYSTHYILESIIEPSKVISDQYQNYTVTKKDGEDVSGRILAEDEKHVVLSPNPLLPDATVEVAKSDITRRAPSPLSPMPTGLLNNMTEDEILDLLAYIQSGGNDNASNFR